METGKSRIGWIGTGVMGRWMCLHCMKAGYPATLYNRSPEKALPLIEVGAHWADSPVEVARQSDIVFCMVGFPADVREVILGPEGVLQGLAPDAVVVDMTTSEPTLALEIDKAARAQGLHALDAPVSGGDIGAREARLSIMVGGDKEIFCRVEPLFNVMGKTVTLMGPAGSGQHTKMVNQILIATNMIGVVEGLLYAQAAGLDPAEVIKIVGAGAAGSWSINTLGPRIVSGDFNPGFKVDHFIKDMGIALEESRRMGLFLPGLALAETLYREVKAQGHGHLGTQALMLALQKMNVVEG